MSTWGTRGRAPARAIFFLAAVHEATTDTSQPRLLPIRSTGKFHQREQGGGYVLHHIDVNKVANRGRTRSLHRDKLQIALSLAGERTPRHDKQLAFPSWLASLQRHPKLATRQPCLSL